MKKKDRREPRPAAPVLAPTPFWKVALGWGVLIWLLFVTFKFEQKFPVSLDPALDFFGAWFDFSLLPFLKASAGYLKSIFFFALAVVGIFSWGAYLVSRLVEETTPFLARTVLSVLVGVIFLSLLITAAGFIGLLRFSYLFVFLAAFALGGCAVAQRQWVELLAVWRTMKISNLIDSPAKFLLFFLCACAFLMAFVPELFYDSLVYHIGLPHMYVLEGRIIDTPHVYFSRSPMLVHMLYVLGVGLDGSTLAKLMNCLMLLVGVGSAFVLCDRFGWRKAAPWAALFYVAIPIVQMNVWSTAVDSAMSGVFAMAVYALLQWRDSERKLSWAALTGLFSGAVFAIKYPGVMVTAGMGGVLLVLAARRLKERSVLLSLVFYGLFSGVTVAPWLVRNYVWTGNPVYPILSSVFESRNINKEKMENEKDATKANKPASLKALIAYPWTQTMLEISNFNFIGPMMLGLLPLLFFLPFKDPSVRIFAGVTLGYFLLELQVLGQLRYIMPGFLLLSVLLAGGLTFLSSVLPLCAGFFKTALIGVTLYHGVWILQCLQTRYLPVPLLLGHQSRFEYSATMHNGLNLWPWNGMAEDIEKLPEPTRVYILGDEQVYGFPKRFWYSSVHDSTPLVLWSNESRNAEDLYQRLHAQGFTHLLINVPETMRLEGYKLFPWTDSGRRAFIDFANRHLELVNVKPIAGYANSLFLFEVKEKPEHPLPFSDFGVFFGKVLHLSPQ